MANVIIVDDEKAIRSLLNSQLSKAGYTVTEAADGEEALKQIRNARPDIIFLDILLPRKDGWQICREIKADSQTSSIPVVLLTASKEKFAEMRGWESGADEYLTKPWEPDTLRALTERLLAPKPNETR